MAEYKNAEGYADPTAFGALCAIEKEEKALRAFRSIVYICSPYAGDVENNTAAARRYCRFAVEVGYIPIAPHLLFPQFLNDSNPKEREKQRRRKQAQDDYDNYWGTIDWRDR